MACKEIIDNATRQQRKTRMKCPVRLYPKCHHKAPIDLFCDGRKRIIYLVCSKCDATLSQIIVKKDPKQ